VKNIPIIGKFLAVLGIFGLFVLATTIYAPGQMQTIGSGYRQLLDGDAKAAVALAWANRSLNATHAYIGDLLIVTSDAENQAVDASLDDSISKFSSFMDAAETLSPVEAGNIAALKARGLQIFNGDCAATIQAAKASTTDAANLAAQKLFRAQCIPNFPALSGDMANETKTLETSIAGNESDLNDSTSHTIMLTYAMILVGLAAVIAGGFFAIRIWVARPITEMQAVMRRISGGDYTAKIAGAERRDEIGGMAQAVQVFKDAGTEKIRLEAEAEAARKQATAAREEAEAARARAAAQVETVVSSLADGLEKLSSGDLLYRLNTAFSAEY
jgi:methyl-accepting chemotaxis protein